MTPSAIIDHFERAWKDGDMLSTSAQLDHYVLWLSEHWSGLSVREREVMLSVGAAVFRQWMAGAGAAPAFSDPHSGESFDHPRTVGAPAACDL